MIEAEPSDNEIDEKVEDVIPPLEVKVIKDKVEEVEEDIDYMDFDISDKEIEEFEKNE